MNQHADSTEKSRRVRATKGKSLNAGFGGQDRPTCWFMMANEDQYGFTVCMESTPWCPQHAHQQRYALLQTGRVDKTISTIKDIAGASLQHQIADVWNVHLEVRSGTRPQSTSRQIRIPPVTGVFGQRMKVCGGLMEQGVVGPHLFHLRCRRRLATTFYHLGCCSKSPWKGTLHRRQSDWQPPRDLSQRQSSNLDIFVLLPPTPLWKAIRTGSIGSQLH